MYVKKRMSLLLFAALAMVLFTACGRWDFSREAAKAANEAQGANPVVTFDTSRALTDALRDAAGENVQPDDIEAALKADGTLTELLAGRSDLDIYFAAGDQSADDAAAAIAAQFGRLTGRKPDAFIAMVKADNGYFYAAVVSYRTGSSSSASDGNGGSTTPDPEPTPDPDPEPEPEPEPTPVLDHISVSGSYRTKYFVGTRSDGNQIPGETFDPTGLVVTAYYKDNAKKPTEVTDTDYEISPDKNFSESGSAEVTISYTEGEVTKEATISVEVYSIYHPFFGNTLSVDDTYSTSQVVGQPFNPVGMSIRVSHYGKLQIPGQTTPIRVTDYMVEKGIVKVSNENLVDGPNKVEITYLGETVTFDVNP